MTASAEAGVSDSQPEGVLDSAWRAAAAERQRRALPHGEVALSCSAPLGTGGLGRHLGEILEALERGGSTASCICGSTRAADTDSSMADAGALSLLTARLARTQLPISPAVRARAFMVEFDTYATARLPRAEHLIAFNGQSLAQAHAARRSGYRSIGVVSANSHMRQVIRQQERAHRRYPIEGYWAKHMLARSIAEYAYADHIYVASSYIRESFLEEGFPDEMLLDFPLTPAPRYTPAERRESDRFDVVYIGSLAVHKGVPLLLDAVARLPHADLRLLLVGSWGTRGMRRHIEAACAKDPRIEVVPGDPLAHLRTASLCVHPAYEDGFAYAPAEALACGVPVIVSADTGMKDLIDSPRSGLVLPTGELPALASAIDAAYRGEVLAR